MITINKPKLKLYGAIAFLLLLSLKTISQFGAEADPIASQMVRSESMDRRMADKEIEADIKLRDNQTAQEISRQSDQQKKLLEKQISFVEKTFELLNQTYNTTDKLRMQNPMLDYLKNQTRTMTMTNQIAKIFRFGTSLLEQESRSRIISHLNNATQLNVDGWNVMKVAMQKDNNMDIKGRLELIDQANQKTVNAQRELIMAMELANRNSKLMETLADIQQLPNLFKFETN
jgi:nitrate reductase NapAB chaperone NapD